MAIARPHAVMLTVPNSAAWRLEVSSLVTMVVPKHEHANMSGKAKQVCLPERRAMSCDNCYERTLLP